MRDVEGVLAGAQQPQHNAGRVLRPVHHHALLRWPTVDALPLAVREGALGKLTVERADGESIVDSPLAAALEAAGFQPTPRGLRLRA
ncbi:hypothetical protein [Actinoallomurus rhizosphaericola]|uniref:hypothetical protein n=1 Tax=Actinoallomurus rhizosphaericola TaxID=2952536 RepID=UPI002091B979|nr:hypothetical protein [Actinoallomurus rhizosphaericola]MCO5992368.1 hypothetical protein [Actinoallomurus rhizosphaericola]